MLVTLFVDASFFDSTRAAAYALYAISPRDKLTYSGRFAQPIRDSSHAELAAIANAIHIVMPHPLAAGAKRLLIQSDSQSAIRWLQERQCRRHPAVLAHILEMLHKWGVEAEFKFIKGHSGRSEARTYCHDWCDREARRLGRKMHLERPAAKAVKPYVGILKKAFPVKRKRAVKSKKAKA